MNNAEPDNEPSTDAQNDPNTVTTATPDSSQESNFSPTTVSGPSKGRNWLRTVITMLLVLALIGGTAYAIYVTGKPAKNVTSASVKKDIAQLNVGVINSTIDLYPAKELDSYVMSVIAQSYEGLVQYQSQSKIVPLLATGWSNPDSSTWDFDLRQNVKFHNGRTMTAEDVVYSINLAKNDKAMSEVYTNTVKDAKVIGPNKVQITTTKPDPFFLNKLTFVMILDSKSPDATDTMNATGPFILKPGTKPSTSKIEFVASDTYHGGHVRVRSLNMINESTEKTASDDLKAGKLNIAGEYNSLHQSELNGLNFQRLQTDDAAVTFMALNSQSPGPLQKKDVREALRDSLDLNLLIKNTGSNAQPTNQMMTKAIPGYNPAVPMPERDLAQAKTLLAKAGYPNGVALSLVISPVNEAIGKEIAKQAAEAGITITLKVQEDFSVLIGDMAEGKSEMSFVSYSSDLLDGSDVFAQVIQGTANYKSSVLDDYLSQADKTIDQPKRLKLLQKTSQYLYDDVAVLPLFNRTRVWVADKPYAVEFDNLASVPGVYFWQVYETK